MFIFFSYSFHEQTHILTPQKNMVMFPLLRGGPLEIGGGEGVAISGKKIMHGQFTWKKKHAELQGEEKISCKLNAHRLQKHTIKAKMHCGRNLWSFLRPQKNLYTRHINVHYNRAHVKNYTRAVFSDNAIKKYVCRRAMDDKAYVRCGTSEGFS